MLALPPHHRRAVLEALGKTSARALESLWRFWAGDDQIAPEGDWHVWLILAGRGFGKTRAGAEWVRAIAKENGAARIALIGATLHEARSVMVEGQSGLLAVTPRDEDILWAPSLRRLAWPNGAQAKLYSAAEPDSLRGPEHSHAWCDEIGKWPDGEAAWDNMMLGMRRGGGPRIVATTTPRPVPLIERLIGEAQSDDKAIIVTRGRTQDNCLNLAPAFIATVEAAYGGTRLGRQELDGELIADIENSLWPRALIEACRVDAAPEMRRIVVAVDPPAGAGEHSDACGIVAAGLGADGRGYVLADASVDGLRPEGWARKVAETAEIWNADRVIAEANQGGEMVRAVLRAAERNLPLRLVHAARGKSARAEPIAAFYERGEVRHMGTFPALEDEMAGLTIDGRYQGPGRSPDRADALVHALTELLLRGRNAPGVRRL
ncbi:terminase family protein [Parasphingopyxis sp.]|uniref:DNA-packaging protein n=1 Tax=Parasphingopyxis sp. TaxID=1920299 RepID=UPI002607253B|nr:terminase family protein [Parasphingopyxis sp.]